MGMPTVPHYVLNSVSVNKASLTVVSIRLYNALYYSYASYYLILITQAFLSLTG